jgi:uncharacterized protein YecT (DUF1311 family)
MKRIFVGVMAFLCAQYVYALSLSEGMEADTCQKSATETLKEGDNFMEVFACLTRQLEHYESQLEQDYQQRLALIERNDYYDIPESTVEGAKSTRPEIRQNFIRSQAEWQKYSASFCAVVAPQHPLAHGNAIEFTQCQINMIKGRIDDIQRMTAAWQTESQ